MSQGFFVGIDISKATLDLAVLPAEQTSSFPNDEKGLQQLASTLAELGAPQAVVMEATGGLERPVLAALAADGFPMVATLDQLIDNAQLIAKAVGKPITLNGYEDDGRAELEFTDTEGVIHTIYVDPKFINKPGR